MASSKNWVFNLYFNYRDEEGRKWAETKRDEGLAYTKKTIERMAQFSVIAKDEHMSSCLMLRGYVHLKSPCARDYVKKVLGKYSNCKMTSHNDIVNLLRFFAVDRNVTVTGELPSQNRRKKDDARWVMKMARDNTGDFLNG